MKRNISFLNETMCVHSVNGQDGTETSKYLEPPFVRFSSITISLAYTIHSILFDITFDGV
jgi:hypothetical protein